MNDAYHDRKRIPWIDCAKGVGIILVVWAHAGGPWSRYINQFHMPFFFLLSGYLYKAYNIKPYFIKKIKTLYIPYISCNLFSMVFRMMFDLDNFLYYFYYSIQIGVMLKQNDGLFFGATWFLASLFITSVLYRVIDLILGKIIPSFRYELMLVLFSYIAACGRMLEEPSLGRMLILMFFFAMGNIIKVYEKKLYWLDNLYVALMCFAAYIFIAANNIASMGTNEYRFFYLFLAGALMASLSLIYFVKRLVKSEFSSIKFLRDRLISLGRRSIDVVIWHLVVFRIIVAIWLFSENGSVREMLQYYPTYKSDRGGWLLYCIAGLSVSVVIGRVVRILLQKTKIIKPIK